MGGRLQTRKRIRYRWMRQSVLAQLKPLLLLLLYHYQTREELSRCSTRMDLRSMAYLIHAQRRDIQAGPSHSKSLEGLGNVNGEFKPNLYTDNPNPNSKTVCIKMYLYVLVVRICAIPVANIISNISITILIV